MEKLSYQRNKAFLWFGEVRDVVIIHNHVNSEMLFQIRVNGYLLDCVYMFPLGKKRYFLREIPHDAEITVENVEEEIDLTLPENCHQGDDDFFKHIGDKYFKKS